MVWNYAEEALKIKTEKGISTLKCNNVKKLHHNKVLPPTNCVWLEALQQKKDFSSTPVPKPTTPTRQEANLSTGKENVLTKKINNIGLV